ncbi:MAG: mechanosensitive ion channel [Pseudomonadales bacterium]|nr:mechanosensitive ion channel [Pseudomonadales bacterium]
MDNLLSDGQKQVGEFSDWITGMVMDYGPGLLLAIITLIIGLWLINRLINLLDKSMTGKVEPTLLKFLHSLCSIGLKVLLLISVAAMVGIETTSFIAVLGAAGLAVGLALQGSLANFAGGALILFFKPFKVGDSIKAQGFAGVVREIQIFNTIITTFDNQRVIIPNALLSNGCLVNVNVESTRRVDMVFGISYDDDIKKAKEILNRLVEADERILKDPAPVIALSELADSSVNFAVRTWVKTPDYWAVYFAMHENVKLTFDAEDISIPYPQRDVHVYNEQK